METGGVVHYNAYKINLIVDNLSLSLLTALEPLVSFCFWCESPSIHFLLLSHSFIPTVVHLTKIQLEVQRSNR